ncbi:MAG: DUF2158 domain-containing protein [Methylophilaceae bacterium]|uniref:DUF2158 domain-containing protein n=1 Tax=Methylovorus sp. MM2 TaxID=1848038 RepID=UPI0013F4D659|nr:DUF2158 domain-containing protein [Methylovorus sp. MM2]
MNKFEDGDLVEIKHGGIPMRVAETIDGSVLCKWLDEYDNVRHARYLDEALILYVR